MFSVVVSILISLNIYPHLQYILSAENITFGDKDFLKKAVLSNQPYQSRCAKSTLWKNW